MLATFQRLPCSLLRLFVVAAVAMTTSGCRRSPEPDPPDGHTQMLALLEQYRQEAAHADPFLESAKITNIRAKLQTLLGARFGREAKERCDLLQIGAEYELRLGNSKAAIEKLEEAFAIAQQKNSPISASDAQHITVRLAVAHLRRAETENCVHCRTGESCILPIREGGVHKRSASTEKAIEYFKLALEQDPNDLVARWLLNVAVMALGTYPDEVPPPHRIDPAKFSSEDEFPMFQNIASSLGLDTQSLLGGAVVDDFDNDGLLDVVVSGWHMTDQLRIYRNLGDGRFEDRTEALGLTGIVGGSNLVQADYDNDGDLDLYVMRGAWLRREYANSLLRNDGPQGFRDVTFEAGLGEHHVYSQTAAWDDFDLDGDLDLYVGNERGPSQLYVNDGKGKFIESARSAGVENLRWAKGVAWGDFNGDRYPDLYVSNYSEGNRLYRNNGNGSLTDVASKLNVATPRHSFPVWFWDFDNDGILDIYVPSYEFGVQHVAAEFFNETVTSEPSRLWKGLPEGGFRDVATEMGLTRVVQPMGANFGDLDNDGFLDFYLGTGYPEYEALMPNVMYRNRNGERFDDITYAGGFGHLQKGHGIAFADFDNDGDQDVFIQLGGAYPGDGFNNALFENPGFDKHWIRIKLVGQRSNRCAIGARIHIELDDAGQTRSIYRWVNSGGSFGANPLTQQIGLGDATTIKRLQIFWPRTDKTQVFENVAADQSLEIHENSSSIKQQKLRSFAFAKSAAPTHDR